jgi:hypothetical protein
MLLIDFQEYKYIDPIILENYGEPTPDIADSLLRLAEEEISKDEIRKRCCIYLEAAKAYNELSNSSYNIKDYLKAAAYYALLKGDLFFEEFKYNININKINASDFIRRIESTCCYYLEAAKLLSFISYNELICIIPKYLVLNFAYYFLKNGKAIPFIDFSWTSIDALWKCWEIEDDEVKKIVLLTLIDLGAASYRVWNALYAIPEMKTEMEKIFNANYREKTYKLINSVFASNPIDTLQEPKEYLKAAFIERQNIENAFKRILFDVSAVSFEGDKIEKIINAWKNISKYDNFLKTVDRETKESIDEILEIAKSYLEKNSVERAVILIKIQKIINTRIDFINQNTTLYGRVYFFPLLSEWKNNVVNLLAEKIVASSNELCNLIENPEDMILNLIAKGENLNIEFKETFSKPVGPVQQGEMEMPRKEMNKQSLKPIVGFLNAEGGTLLIGVGDKGNITGIENDYFDNEDRYLLYFNNVIKERIGLDCFSFIDYGLFRVKDKLILKVNCKPSTKPQFIDKKDFYVRTSPATREYIGPDLLDYVKRRFKN